MPGSFGPRRHQDAETRTWGPGGFPGRTTQRVERATADDVGPHPAATTKRGTAGMNEHATTVEVNAKPMKVDAAAVKAHAAAVSEHAAAIPARRRPVSGTRRTLAARGRDAGRRGGR